MQRKSVMEKSESIIIIQGSHYFNTSRVDSKHQDLSSSTLVKEELSGKINLMYSHQFELYQDRYIPKHDISAFYRTWHPLVFSK